MLNKLDKLSDNITLCPCHSGKPFSQCCQPFINLTSAPQNPEQLMRSRFSAYSIKNENYLLSSWHNSTRPESLDLTNDSTQWKKLKIISAKDNKVHFVAFFTQDTLNNEKTYALSEESNFVKEERWLYLNGEKVKTVQLTQNMPCPCLSGQKYKRCCGS